MELTALMNVFRPFNRDSVMVIAIDGEDLLLVREYAVGTEQYELGFVKGGMDMGETPEQSANRELQEEIGFGAKKMDIFTYHENQSTNHGSQNARVIR